MKKMLSCILAGALALQGTQNIANATAQGSIEVGSASISAGETFELPVMIKDNPGIASLNLSLIYDTDKLELLGAEDGKILGTSTFLTTDSPTKNPYILSWDDLSTKNHTETGTVATLSFRAKDNAAGNAKVSVEVNQQSTYNVDLDEVAFETSSGTVSIMADENAPAIIVETIFGNQGDIVEMPIRIRNNPGVASLNLSISYDNTKLKLLGAEDGKILGSSTYLTTDSLTKIPYILSWDDLSTENNTENGIVATLKFEVLAAEGDAPVEITVNQRSTYNVNLEEVVFAVISGMVNIGSPITTMTSATFKTTTTTPSSLHTTTTTEMTSAQSEYAAIIADTVSGNQSSTVEMPIRIQNNPGIAALNLSISYDSTKLRLLGAEDGRILGKSTFLTTDSLTKIPYILSWDDLATKNNTGNGILATLLFEVLAAEGDADVEITVNQRSTYNVDLEEVVFTVISGAVLISPTSAMTTTAKTATTTTATTTSTTKATTTTSSTTSTTTKATTTTSATTSTTTKTTTTTTSTTSTTTKATTTTSATTSTTTKATTTTTATTSTTTKATTTTTVITTSTTKATTTTSATTTTTTKAQTTTTTTGITTSLTQSTATTTLETTAIPLNDATIIVDTVSGTTGDTVAVPIRIQHNPGIAALSLNVSYDSSKLKLLGAEDGKILGESTFLTTDSLKKIPYILSWDDLSTKNNTGNGILATLNFEVIASEGDADVEITVNQRSTYNVDLEDVVFSTANGAVQIRKLQSGDMNGDGELTVADAVLLARFVSEDTALTDEQIEKILDASPDQDEDGLVTILDVFALLNKLKNA